MSNGYVKKFTGGPSLLGAAAPSYFDALGGTTPLGGLSSIRVDNTSPLTAVGAAGIGGLVSAQQVDEQRRRLDAELVRLRSLVASTQRDLESARGDASATAKHAKELADRTSELERKVAVSFLLDSISEPAQAVLMRSKQLEEAFLSEATKPLCAVSIDIRRSTELMLKAKSTRLFATFITELCHELIAIIKDHHGVVDKFTGDGILCFFPEFFAGPDAGYLALAAASTCHDAFERHYRGARSSFNAVPADIGLGIGVDYGECQLVKIAGTLTIVGVPVVYACRLAGAPARTTLVNQPAYDVIANGSAAPYVAFSPTEIDVKHEGSLLAYAARVARDGFQPERPGWLDYAEAGSQNASPEVAAANAESGSR